MQRLRTYKRPCRICRKWFMPDPRQIGRQKTCGDPACRRESHRRQCRQWNRKNTEYFKANYLSAKLARTKDPPTCAAEKPGLVPPPSRIQLNLPRDDIVAVIGPRHLVIVEYIFEQMVRLAVVKSSLRPPQIAGGF